jgi:hypothetical protein
LPVLSLSKQACFFFLSGGRVVFNFKVQDELLLLLVDNHRRRLCRRVNLKKIEGRFIAVPEPLKDDDIHHINGFWCVGVMVWDHWSDPTAAAGGGQATPSTLVMPPS